MSEHSLPVSFYLLLLCGLLAINVSVYQTLFAPKVLKVTVFEVGKGLSADRQGTATLVQSPNKKTLLIDTGPDASILRSLGTALPEWQRHIDSVILTSGKASFAGGMPTVESRYHIKTHTSIGGETAPYGTQLPFDGNTLVTIIAPGTFTISQGSSSFLVSSTTQPKTYVFK